MSGDSSDDCHIPKKVARLSTSDGTVPEVSRFTITPANATTTTTTTTTTALPAIPTRTLWSHSYFHDRSYDRKYIPHDAIEEEIDALNKRYWKARLSLRTHKNVSSDFKRLFHNMKRIEYRVWLLKENNFPSYNRNHLTVLRDCLNYLQEIIEEFEVAVAINDPTRELEALKGRFLLSKEMLQKQNSKKIEKLRNDENYIESCFGCIMGDINDLKPYARIEEGLGEVLTEITKFEEAVNGDDSYSDPYEIDDDPVEDDPNVDSDPYDSDDYKIFD